MRQLRRRGRGDSGGVATGSSPPPTATPCRTACTGWGEAALAAAPDVIREVTLRTMPNVHYLPIDLSRFGEDARGAVFLPTDEPSGQIEATLRKG